MKTTQEEMEKHVWDVEIASWNGLATNEQREALWDRLARDYPNSELLKRRPVTTEVEG